jgi:hypothetical protein
MVFILFFTKEAVFTRRSSVLSLPLQMEFPSRTVVPCIGSSIGSSTNRSYLLSHCPGSKASRVTVNYVFVKSLSCAQTGASSIGLTSWEKLDYPSKKNKTFNRKSNQLLFILWPVL